MAEDVDRLFVDMMKRTPSERLIIAATILSSNPRPTLAGLAIRIARGAIDEVELGLLLGSTIPAPAPNEVSP